MHISSQAQPRADREPPAVSSTQPAKSESALAASMAEMPNCRSVLLAAGIPSKKGNLDFNKFAATVSRLRSIAVEFGLEDSSLAGIIVSSPFRFITIASQNFAKSFIENRNPDSLKLHDNLGFQLDDLISSISGLYDGLGRAGVTASLHSKTVANHVRTAVLPPIFAAAFLDVSDESLKGQMLALFLKKVSGPIDFKEEWQDWDKFLEAKAPGTISITGRILQGEKLGNILPGNSPA